MLQKEDNYGIKFKLVKYSGFHRGASHVNSEVVYTGLRRKDCGMAVYADKVIYLCCGLELDYEPYFSDSVDTFHLDSRTMSRLPKLKKVLYDHFCTVLGKKLYIYAEKTRAGPLDLELLK